MQNFTVFDIVIVSITVLLGLKGLLRGFIKEVFGLVGIIGGIFVASRMSDDIGSLIAPVLALENGATIKLIGFVVGLVGFWIIVYILGVILSKIFSMSGLGLLDRIFGFVFGSAKIFFIFSVIVYSLYQFKSFKNLMDEKAAESITFPLLVSTGNFIVKLDPSDFMGKNEEEVKKDDEIVDDSPDLVEKKSFAKEISDTVKDIKDTTVKSSEEVINKVKESVANEVSDSIKNKAEESNQEETAK